MLPRLRQWLGDERGATAVEYAVMLALILLVAIGAVAAFGTATQGSWTKTSNSLNGMGS